MIIRVLDMDEAPLWKPTRPSAMIRIYEPALREEIKHEIVHTYDTILTYGFIDLIPWELEKGLAEKDPLPYLKKTRILDGDLAHHILSDFGNIKEGLLEVVIHCAAGVARYPAVALALDQAYHLQSTILRRTCFFPAGIWEPVTLSYLASHRDASGREYNVETYIYETLMREAVKMGLR